MSSQSIPFADKRIVNTITAAPLLNLMLAMDGMEGPGDPRQSWEVFKRFALVPSSSSHDVLGFQAGWIEVPGGDPALYCSWVRQLTDDAAGHGSVTRAIQLEYAYDERLLSVPDTLELWSDEYRNLPAFFIAVESQTPFEFLIATPAGFTGVYVREEVSKSAKGVVVPCLE